MKIKVTGRKQFSYKNSIPKAIDGLFVTDTTTINPTDISKEPTTPGNFYVYGPNGEIFGEKDSSGNIVKNYYPQGYPGYWDAESQPAQSSFSSGFVGMPETSGSLSFPSFKQSIAQSAPGKCPDGQKKNPLTGMCEPAPNFGGSNFPQIKSNLGQGFVRNPETNLYGKPADTFPKTTKTTTSPVKKPTNKKEYNPLIGISRASMVVGGMGLVNNLIRESQEQRDYKDYMRRLGSTDASNPVVKNAYSRGRNVMNTPAGADYAPNMMTPVQFAGRPVSEFAGYPVFPYNQYGKDGLLVAAEGVNFAEDVLGLPSMVENPDMYREVNIPELSAPELAPPSTPSQQQAESPELISEAPSEVAAAPESGYMMPVKNFKLTSGFGSRKAPIKGASSDHNGVDLAVPFNSDVFAPMDGVVQKIYFNDKGGKQLIIKHSDGTTSGFAHLNDYKVNIGDRVTKGQIVALSGNTGNSSGPHLHFTFRNADGNIVNPLDYFNIDGGNAQHKGLSNYDHNNPGNIHIGDFAKGYGGTKGRKDGDGYVAVFPNPQAGMKAMEDLIFSPSYANLTISQARNKWVNGKPTVSSSSTPYIVSALGGDYRVADLSPAQRKKLISEFVKWEDRKVYNRYKEQGLVFKEGGEYELDDDEINYILANGGTVEYL